MAALRAAAGLVVVDPNPRPNLIADMEDYRAGAERAIAVASLVKLSDEDASLLYDDLPVRSRPALLALGAETVLFTHGSDGAAIMTRCRDERRLFPSPVAKGRWSTPWAPETPRWRRFSPSSSAAACRPQQVEWGHCLDEAMRVAAATCASPGGSLVLPKGPPSWLASALDTERGWLTRGCWPWLTCV